MMSTEAKASGAGKVKPSNQDGPSKGKVDSSSLNKKKIDSSIKPQLRSPSTVTKTEVFHFCFSSHVDIFFGVFHDWFHFLVVLGGGVLL